MIFLFLSSFTLLLTPLLVRNVVSAPLLVSEHVALTRVFVQLGLTPRVPLLLAETANLLPVVPDCPAETATYTCDSAGLLRSVSLRFDGGQLAPRSRDTAGRTSVWDGFAGSLFNDLKGARLDVAVRGHHGVWPFAAVRVNNLSIADSQLHNLYPNASLFEYGVASTLFLANCSLLGFRLPPRPPADLKQCRFVNVALPCPVPLWIDSLCGLRDANATCFTPPATPANTLALNNDSAPSILAPRDSPLVGADGVLATDEYRECEDQPMDCSAYGVPPPLLLRGGDDELVCLRACQLFDCTRSARVGGERNVSASDASYPCRAVLSQTCSFASLGQCGAHYYRPGNVTTNATIDVGFQTMLHTIGVSVGQPFGIGLVTRVELWNVTAGEFVLAFERPHTERRVRQVGVAYETLFVRRPMLTSRVRLRFESLLLGDVLGAIVLVGALRPIDAYAPPPLCAPPFALDNESMLDETRADSLCVNALCQEPCVVGIGAAPAAAAADGRRTVSFGVAVASPAFVVVEGDATAMLDDNAAAVATLVNQTSVNTRVYALRANASHQTLTLVGGDARVRLVGQPLAGDALPSTLPSSLAPRVPGLFVKRRAAATAVVVPADGCPVQLISPRVGATCVWSAKRAIFVGGSGDGAPSARVDVFDRAANRWAAPLTAPFESSNASAALLRDATLFVMTAGVVQRLDLESGRWSVPSWPLSELALNDGQAAPPRKLVAVGDALLVVIAAFVQPFHDGLRRPLLAGRRVVDTPLDVVVVARDVVYRSLMTHDFDTDIGALDVLPLRNGSFAVARRDGDGHATLFEWRPLAYELQECTEQTACDACINDFRNVESCRWCSALGQCLARTSSCTPSLLDASMCPILTTVATTTSTDVTDGTIATTTGTNGGTILINATSADGDMLTAMMSASPSNVGLIVGVTIAAIVAVTLILGGLLWFFVRRGRQSADEPQGDEQQQMNRRNEIEMSARTDREQGDSEIAKSAQWYDSAPVAGGESDSIAYRAVAKGSEVPGYHLEVEEDESE